jgi:hypothetical protein
MVLSLMAGTVRAEIQVYPQQVEIAADAPAIRLLVSSVGVEGTRIEVTDQCNFISEDEGVLKIGAQGELIPVRDGVGSIDVQWEGERQRVTFTVTGCAERSIPDFGTEIQAILASAGCSTGACHGKQGGQNGFQLSLLGFDSDFDYASITEHARGRRLFFASPDKSLLLQKALAEVPHGGGRRFTADDPRYLSLLRWIEGGAPRTSAAAPQVVALRVEPRELVLVPEVSHRLVAIATFADGRQRDVTRLTAFSSNESAIAGVGGDGKVTAGPIVGEATIMARFLDHIATADVLLPRTEAVDDEVYAALPSEHTVDRLVWKKLRRLNITPSAAASDSQFLRRVYLDIIGRQPTLEQTQRFLEDDASDKRERLIDELLAHPAYADHWANKWVDLLRPNAYRVGIKAVLSLDDWVRQAFRENRPYDEFVRGLLTAQGSTWHNGATTMFRDRRSPDELTTTVSQLFLGVRLECAKCHHHPFEVWGQDDFYSFAAFFSRVKYKGTGLSPPISGGEEIVFVADQGSVSHPRTGEVMPLRTLGGTDAEVGAGDDPRAELVRWMTSDENPYFARVIANRVWADLMGRGIVEPVDDMRATNPPSNEALLDALAEHLRAHDYDLKSLIRLIVTSRVYALDSIPNETNVADHRNYSRHYRQRLRAEVLLDAINDILDVDEPFDAMPVGSRANQIWTHRIPSLFLDTFSRPDMNQDPPCERAADGSVVQALHLMNSPELHRKVKRDGGWAARLAASTELTVSEKVTQVYMRVYCRLPNDDERQTAEGWIERAQNPREAIEDLLWAMLNSAEFVLKD